MPQQWTAGNWEVGNKGLVYEEDESKQRHRAATWAVSRSETFLDVVFGLFFLIGLAIIFLSTPRPFTFYTPFLDKPIV